MVIESALSSELDRHPDDDTVEIAQAGPGEPVGQITAAQGTVTITRTDGAKVEAADGTPIFAGDLVETDSDGAVGIAFADESTFSLAEKGSMVIDEMVYDPSTKTGKSSLSVAEGVFTFVSGQIAKTEVDAMEIKTPIATIGIRGTEGGGRAGAEGSTNTLSLFGGEMAVKTLGGAPLIMNQPGQTTQMTSAYVPPTRPVKLPPAALQRFFAKAAAVSSKNVFDPQSGGPAVGDDGPDAGPTDEGPADAGPTDETPAADDAATADTDDPVETAALDPEQAAAEAFEQVLAQGGSLDDAMQAAQGSAAEAELQTVLADNPDAFGSVEAAEAVMNRIVEDVVLKVTGQVSDVLGAGTGRGTGQEGAARGLLTGGLDFINDPFGGLIGGPGGDFIDGPGDIFGPIFGPGDFFDPIFGPEDPFLPIFFGDFDDDGFPDDDDFDPFLPPPDDVVFAEELFATASDDILAGGPDNTEFAYIQSEAAFGGNDTITDTGGTNDRITFEDISDVALRMITHPTDPTNQVLIEIDTGVLSANSDSVTNTELSFASPDNVINLSREVEDLQASVVSLGGFFDGDDTIVLANATDVTGSQVGMIVAGQDGDIDETIDLSGVSGLIGAIVAGRGGNDTLTTAASDDILIGGAGNDVLNGLGGNNVIDGDEDADTINVTVAASNNTIDGGDLGTNTDTLTYSTLGEANTYSISTGGSVSRTSGSDFFLGIETLNGTNNGDTYNISGNQDLQALGTYNAGTGDDTFSFAVGTTFNNKSIDAGTGTDTINIDAEDVSATSTFNGNTGTDTFALTDGGTVTSTEIAGVTNFETLRFNANADYTVTLNDANVASGQTLSIVASSVLTGSTATVDVTNETDGTIAYTGGNGADILTIAASRILATDPTLSGGGGTGDELHITSSNETLSSTDLAGITNWESIVLDSNAPITMTLSDNNIASGQSMTLNATAVTSQSVTIDASAEADGTFNYAGGGGTDIVTVDATRLSAVSATMTGGGGTDTLRISASGTTTLTAANLSGVTAFETLLLNSNQSYTITLSDNNATASQSVTINGNTVQGNNAAGGVFLSVDASAETDGQVRVIVDTNTLEGESGIILTGGQGTSDFLQLNRPSVSVNLSSTELGGITAFETWKLGSNNVYNLTLDADNVASGATLSIDATSVTSASVTVDASAETDGTLNYDGSTGAITDTLTVASAMLEGAAATLDGGAGTADELIFVGTADLDATELANIGAWETWTLNNNVAYTLTLSANNAQTATLVIDATNLTSATATIDISNETGTPITYQGGAGDDSLTVAGELIDNNTLILDGNNPTASDTLTITGSSALIHTAAELQNIVEWETWVLGSDVGYNLTLNTANAGTSALTITATAVTTAGNLVRVDAVNETDGGTIALTIDGGALETAAGTAAILTGSSGSDTLTINASAALTLDATELATVTAWETWTLGSDASYDLTLNTANAGAGALTINALAVTTAGNLDIDASAETTSGATLALTVFADALNTGAGTAATITGTGADGTDTLTIQGSGSINLDATELGSVSAWENWTFNSNIGTTVTLAAGNVAGGGTLTIDTTAATSGLMTFDLSAVTASTVNYLGATTGLGGDRIDVSVAMLEHANGATLQAGTNSGGVPDTLDFVATAASDLDATELGNITGFEDWNLFSNQAYTLTLASDNAGSGQNLDINTQLANTGAVTVDARLVTLGTIDYEGNAGVDTLTVASSMVDGATVNLDANAGTSDSLTFIGGADLNASELGSVLRWETWTLATDAAYTLTLAENNIASGATLNIDASALSGGTNNATVDTTLETNGTIGTFTGGAGSSDTLTSDVGMDLTNATLSAVESVAIDANNDEAAILTLTGVTLGGADITGTGGNDLVTTTGSLDASNVAFSNIATITIDSDGSGQDTLTLSGATLGGADITGTSGGGNDLVTTTGSLDASNVVFNSIATITIDSDDSGQDTLTITGATLNGADIAGTATTEDLVTSATDAGIDISGVVLTNIDTITMDSDSNSGGVVTLTMDSTSDLNGADVATGASNAAHLHIEFGAAAGDTAIDFSDSHLFTNSTNAENSILLDVGANTAGAVTLTANNQTVFADGSGNTQIREGDSVDLGTSINIISSPDGLDFRNVILFDVATVNLDTGADTAADLLANSNTNLDDATIVGQGTNDRIVLSDGGTTISFANNTLTNIASIQGGTGADNITGSSGGDVISGNAGADTLDGGAGDDSFLYTATADLFSGFSLVDTAITGGGGTGDAIVINNNGGATFNIFASDNFTGVTGVEKIAANATDQIISISLSDAVSGFLTTVDLSGDTDATANNVIDVSAESATAYTLTGSAGIDTITGGAGADTVDGGAGNDIITGGGGADTLDGGAGDDSFAYVATADLFSGFALVDSAITGNTGTADAILINNNGGATFNITASDNFTGVTGIEKITANASDQIISIILSDAVSDFLTIVDLSGDTDSTATNVVNVGAETSTAYTLTGSAGIDDLHGGDGADTINGGAGNDIIFGDLGADTLIGGAGDDSFEYDVTTALFSGSTTVDAAITGGDGTGDSITIEGGAAFTILATDVFDGVTGIEKITVKGATDKVISISLSNAVAELGITTIDLSADTDASTTNTVTIDGDAFTNVIDVSAETTVGYTLTGSSGADAIDGGDGADTINGGAGDDVIFGHLGANVLTGGAGNDTFVFSAAEITATLAGGSIDGTASQTDIDTIEFDDGAVTVDFTGETVTGIDAIELAVNGAHNLTITDDIAATADEDQNGTTGDLEISASVAISSSVTINASALTGTNSVAIRTTNFDGADTFTGGAGNDILGGGNGSDTLTGNAGDDTFTYFAQSELFSGNALVDAAISGGTGTDAIAISASGAAFTIANTLDFTNASSVEKIVVESGTGATANAYSITLSDAAAEAAGFNTIDLSADTNASGANVIDVSAETSVAFTLTGSAGNDTITGGGGTDTIRGGTGADTITAGATGDQFEYTSGDVAAAGQTTVAHDTLVSFTAGASGNIIDWQTDLSNNGTTVGASNLDLTSSNIVETILGSLDLDADVNVGIFEISGSSLGTGNDIIIGSTTSATIEGWAATALALTAHNTGDNLLFVMYDDGVNQSGTSTAAVLEFTADSTLTGIVAGELQLVAVLDVTQDSLTEANFV